MWTTLRVMTARVRDHWRRDKLDRELDQELAAHLAMAEDDKVRQGMSREEARRTARVELGGLTQLREASREVRGLPWLDTLGIDFKLGLRMLRKSWGLTLVGGLAMTVAIGIGAVVFGFFDMVLAADLPLDEGDRVVALLTWDDKENHRHTTSRDDFDRWREHLRSVEDVGAFRQIERNLVAADGGPGEAVSIAEMTASGFQLARVPPLLGRPLVESDERDGADPVVVIGYDVWQSRFAADPRIVGRTVRIGDTIHTVVGVMPEGFAFPINHGFWTPLRPDRSATLSHGRTLDLVFARLAPGVTLEGAEAELKTLGLLPAAGPAGLDQEFHPRVLPYTIALASDDDPAKVRWMVRIILMFIVLLLVPPCANIAILVYARTVTRQEEFAARFVLGASRGRIVLQIFVEVLVLAAAASGVALLLVRQGAWQLGQRHPDAPFWIDFSLSWRTVLFVAVLAVLAALIAGTVPALKATGRRMQSGLRSLGSRTGVQLGATWTVLVVAQVAFSAAALPSAVEMGWGTLRTGILGPGFAAEEFLTARLAIDEEGPGGGLQAELVRRLEAEPAVADVTVSATAPGEEPWVTIEVEGFELEVGIFAGSNLVRANRVDEAFFDAFDVSLLAGRGFEAGDFETAANVVVVNRTLVEDLLEDADPSATLLPTSFLGRRVRYLGTVDEEARGASEPPTWYEIVGIVTDVPKNEMRGTMYHPLARGALYPASVSLRVESAPITVADRLREVTAALDPTLRLEEIRPLDEIYRQQAVGNNLGATALAAVTLSVLLLSAAGIYALMSFTVNQRRREIGIRSALGASPSRLLAGIFRRALRQLSVGGVGGVGVALLIGYYLPIEDLGGWNVPGIVPAAAALMMLIGLLATAGPARRGLRVEPIEELREG